MYDHKDAQKVVLHAINVRMFLIYFTAILRRVQSVNMLLFTQLVGVKSWCLHCFVKLPRNPWM